MEWITMAEKLDNIKNETIKERKGFSGFDR